MRDSTASASAARPAEVSAKASALATGGSRRLGRGLEIRQRARELAESGQRHAAIDPGAGARRVGGQHAAVPADGLVQPAGCGGGVGGPLLAIGDETAKRAPGRRVVGHQRDAAVRSA